MLKGPALAQQLYGTLAVRQMRDLDLLVDPSDLARAIGLLKREGYVPTNVGNDDALRPDRAPMFKDVEFRHATSGMIVEVHGRLGENDALLPVASLASPEPVEVMPDRIVQALTGASQLRYLIVYGFRHGWMRLKWLVDVATILREMERPARDAFLLDMRRRGLGAVSDSTVLLVQRVFPGSPAMIDEARASRRARWCAAVGERYLRGEREGEQQVTTRLLVTGTRLLGSSRKGYLAREVARLLIDSGVVSSLGGRRGAIAVSMLLRPVALPLRVVRNSLRVRR